MITVYGIKNCDTVKKARAWLNAHDKDHQFHDFRQDGLTPELLGQWETRLGWEALVNRKGTTWRSLPEAERADLDRDKALRLMLTYPALIKRPVLVHDDQILLGFDSTRYADRL